MQNVTFGEVTIEDLSKVDEVSLIKLIRIEQLITEYLLYTQDYYQGKITKLSTELQQANGKVNLFCI